MPVINSMYFGSGGPDTSDATATASQILAPYTAYTASGKVTGTVPSLGAQTITPGTTNKTIQSGRYLSGTQTILGNANLLAENIAKGVSIFGVAGQARVVEYLIYSNELPPISSDQKTITIPGEWQYIAGKIHFSSTSFLLLLVEQGFGYAANLREESLVTNSYSSGNTILTFQNPLSDFTSSGSVDGMNLYVWKT